MKETLTFIGLVILSVLYLFEVDFAHIGMMNYIAFGIIILTFIPLVWSFITRQSKKRKERKGKRTPPSVQ